MFSDPGNKAAHIVIANAEEVAALQYTYGRNKQLLISEQLCLLRIIKSLDSAIQLNSTAYTREEFLTAIALSLKIFLETVLRSTTNAECHFENAAVQLVGGFQECEQQLCASSLGLCSSSESVFWQTMMGAIAAPNPQTKSFYTSRLQRITIALALTSWRDALLILQRYFWIPSIFSAPGRQILSEILHS